MVSHCRQCVTMVCMLPEDVVPLITGTWAQGGLRVGVHVYACVCVIKNMAVYIILSLGHDEPE